MPKKKDEKPRRANGEGTFKERKDGRIEYQVVVGMALDGSYIRKSFYGKTEAEARNNYKEYLKENPIPLEKVKTVGEYAKNWLPNYKKGKVTDGTYGEYETIINDIIIANIGKIRLPELRRSHVEKMMRAASKYSVSRQRKVCFLARAILESAIDDHFCKENAASKVKPPKPVEKEIEIYKRREIEMIFDQDDPFIRYVALLFLTGVRRGELLALSWRNVDMEEGVIRIKQALSDGKIEDRTKGKRDRVIPIYPELKAVLEMIPKTGFTVVTLDGVNPMTKDQFRHRFEKLIKSAGVDFKSPHKCRHSFITYLVKSGIPLSVVQKIAGHESLAITEKYTHVNTDDLKDNIVKLKF